MKLFSRHVFIGFICVLAGAVIPFGIMMGAIESNFFINLVAYVASFVGLFLGIMGVAIFVGDDFHQDDW